MLYLRMTTDHYLTPQDLTGGLIRLLLLIIIVVIKLIVVQKFNYFYWVYTVALYPSFSYLIVTVILMIHQYTINHGSTFSLQPSSCPSSNQEEWAEPLHSNWLCHLLTRQKVF